MLGSRARLTRRQDRGIGARWGRCERNTPAWRGVFIGLGLSSFTSRVVHASSSLRSRRRRAPPGRRRRLPVQNRATADGARVLDQVLQLVSQRFVDTVSSGALYEKAARGLVKELNDPYSELFTPKELASFSQQTNGKYAGIGMQIEEQQGAITISTRLPAHAGRGRGRARGRPDRLRRHAVDAWLEDPAGLRLPDRRAGHQGHGEVPAPRRDRADHEHVHARR